MNIIRTIENTTLLTVGALCAVAISSILLHSADVLTGDMANVASVPVTQLPAVVIVGKRLSSIETSHVDAKHVAG
ncbi:MAG TPA: hypothetical protein VNW52_07005 [Burkholderiaceae bacterium]|jgi:hypothetical protein|nr:hypothetical protein [Burkholderiaceae bacterium]